MSIENGCNVILRICGRNNPKVIVIVVKILVRGRGHGRGYQYIDLAKPKSGVRVGLFSSPSLH